MKKLVQSRKKPMETEKTSMYNLKFSIFIANVIRGGSKSGKKSKTQKDTRLGINKFGKLRGKKSKISKKCAKILNKKPRKDLLLVTLRTLNSITKRLIRFYKYKIVIIFV